MSRVVIQVGIRTVIDAMRGLDPSEIRVELGSGRDRSEYQLNAHPGRS